MIWNKKFDYPPSTRSLVMGQRHYDIGNDKLPSVTTILSQTQPEEKKAKLAEWQQKVGKNEADRKSTRLNSSHGYISYAVFCLKKKKKKNNTNLA